jgi:short-subunit dehydrogenase
MTNFGSYGGWALVTGASSGIGAAFARRIAADRVNLALVARRAERLEALATELRAAHGVEVRVIDQDLGEPDAAVRIVERLSDVPVRVLVNNAGFNAPGRFDLVPVEKLVEMIQVHCVAVVALTRALLPAMRASGRGAVLIVSSAAAYQPMGCAATYSATKAFDLLLGEGLWAECRGTGVDILVLCPGATETEFQAVAKELPHPGATPESVVEASVATLGRKPSVVPGVVNSVRAFAVRLVPRAQAAKLAHRVMQGWLPETMR